MLTFQPILSVIYNLTQYLLRYDNALWCNMINLLAGGQLFPHLFSNFKDWFIGLLGPNASATPGSYRAYDYDDEEMSVALVVETRVPGKPQTNIHT